MRPRSNALEETAPGQRFARYSRETERPERRAPVQGGLYLPSKGLGAGELKPLLDNRVSFCFSGVDAPEDI